MKLRLKQRKVRLIDKTMQIIGHVEITNRHKLTLIKKGAPSSIFDTSHGWVLIDNSFIEQSDEEE